MPTSTTLSINSFKNYGFTLVELLVSITIIAVMVGLLLPQLGAFNKYQSLENAAKELQSNLRKAQNFAASGVLCGPALNQNAEGWSIKFIDTGGYSIMPNSPSCSGVPQTSYQFPPGVELSSVKLDGTTITLSLSSNPLLITFTNLTGQAILTDPSDPIGLPYNKIELNLSGSGNNSLVVVEKSGSVYLSKP